MAARVAAYCLWDRKSGVALWFTICDLHTVQGALLRIDRGRNER